MRRVAEMVARRILCVSRPDFAMYTCRNEPGQAAGTTRQMPDRAFRANPAYLDGTDS